MTTLTPATHKQNLARLRNVLPDELFSQFEEISARWRKDYWMIGDITNLICNFVRNPPDDAREKLVGIGIMDVYDLVAIALNHEISARTVRYYAATAAYFDEPMRKKYLDLPFSHFVLAMQYGLLSERILQSSQEYFERIGNSPSAGWLTVQFQKDIYDQQEDAVSRQPFFAVEPAVEENLALQPSATSDLENRSESPQNLQKIFYRDLSLGQILDELKALPEIALYNLSEKESRYLVGELKAIIKEIEVILQHLTVSVNSDTI